MPEESSTEDPFAHLIDSETAPPQQSSFMQKAGALAKGAMAGAVGAIPDTATLAYNIPAMAVNAAEEFEQRRGRPASYVPDPLALAKKGYETLTGQKQELPLIPSATEAAERELSHIMGETPEEVKHLAKGAEFAGALLGPGALAKGASILSKKGLAEGLGAIGATKPSDLAAAAAAGTTLSATEEGLGSPAALGLSLGAAGLTKGAINVAKKVPKTPTELYGKVLSIGAKPNEKAIEIAKKHGIEAPLHTLLDSKLLSFLHNSYLKSVMSAEKFFDKVKTSDQKMIDKVVKNIDSVNPEKLEKEGVSKTYRETLSKEALKTEKKADELYDSAHQYLNPEDKVKPSHTMDAIKDLKGKLTASVPSSDMKFMLNKIDDLEQAWGLIPKGTNLKELQKKHPPYVFENIVKSLKTNSPDIPLDQLIQQRSAFMRDIKYGEEARGAKGFMNSLISAIDKDISSTANKDFLNNWREANKFYKNEVADRIRTDFAKSLKEGHMPKEAYNYMGSVQNIKELERILGSSPATKQVMNGLKKAKLQQVVLDQITNADGVMSYANLANLFNKKSTSQGMLKELLGKQNYQELHELAELSASHYKAGKEFANPSASALRKEDFDRIGKLFTNLISVGTIGTFSPYVLSRVVSSPKYVDSIIKHARARTAKDATKYKTQARQTFIKQILPQVREDERAAQEE